jgi:hypothetical protein
MREGERSNEYSSYRNHLLIEVSRKIYCHSLSHNHIRLCSGRKDRKRSREKTRGVRKLKSNSNWRYKYLTFKIHDRDIKGAEAKI